MNTRELIKSKKWKDLWNNNTDLRMQAELVILEAAIEQTQKDKQQIKEKLEKLLGLNQKP